jgi:protein SCO1/2
MRPHIILISLVLMLLTLGLILFLAATWGPPAGTLPDEETNGAITALPNEDPNPYADFFVPEFSLTDRNGDPVTHDVLDGELTVVDFFFTSCPLWCPGMSTAMARVQNETKGTGARLMSISIDGDNDTPAVIDRYASQYGADPARWTFATGDPAFVAGMVKEGLKFEIGEAAPDPKTGAANINHPTRLILLGPDRRVIGLYRYDDPAEVDALIAKIKAMQG